MGKVIALDKKQTKPRKKKAKAKTAPSVSNVRKPSNMSVSDWQTTLRKHAAAKGKFRILDQSGGNVYGDYRVSNQDTGASYKVAIRSADNSLNYCSCFDFKTNQLGTCKHIETVLLKINKSKTGRQQLKEPYQPEYSSLYLEYRGERKLRFRIAEKFRKAFATLLSPFLNKDGSLNDQGYRDIHSIIQKALKIDPSLRIYDDAIAHAISIREYNDRSEFLSSYSSKKKLPPLKSLKAKPFPYQTEGILFCATAGRSILADEMGLGKTVQAIGTAQLMQEYFHVQKVLIICPTSLKYQWQAEIGKFATSIASVVEGNYLKRRDAYKQADDFYKIISYNMAVNDVDLINDYQPDLIILDEAQRIKNWQTKVSRTLKKLRSKYCIVLTGTPIENRLQELYSLSQFISPLLLGSLYNFISAHEKLDENGKVIGYTNLNQVKEKLKDILIRRTRSQVAQELPARMDKMLFVDITNEQRELHDEYQRIVIQLVNRWRKTGFLSEDDRQRLMILLNQMRMVCNSTYILDQETNYQTKLDELLNILSEIVDSGDEKIVIFSQWERFTRLIAAELERLKIGYATLNGRVPGNKRKKLFDSFNNDPSCRVFLSTDAGGVGLNLQAGSWLINMDLPWNPAVLEQRIARVYRHGQTKPVNVVNVVAQGTIEQGMIAKLKFKKALFQGVLDNGEPDVFMGDTSFNLFMQGVEELMNEPALSGTAEDNFVDDQSNFEKPVLSSDKSDEDILSDVEENQREEKSASPQEPVFNQQEFAAGASNFISQLAGVLSNPEATQQLVRSLTHKDESTGQTYLKIPVAGEESVKNLVGAIASLFGGR